MCCNVSNCCFPIMQQLVYTYPITQFCFVLPRLISFPPAYMDVCPLLIWHLAHTKETKLESEVVHNCLNRGGIILNSERLSCTWVIFLLCSNLLSKFYACLENNFQNTIKKPDSRNLIQITGSKGKGILSQISKNVAMFARLHSDRSASDSFIPIKQRH